MELVIISLLVIILLIPHAPGAYIITMVAGLLVYFVFGLFAYLAGKRKFINLLYRKIQKGKLLKKIFRKTIERMRHEEIGKEELQLDHFLSANKTVVFKTFLFQLLVILADGSTLYFLFHGLGINISPLTVVEGMMATKIISIIPFLPESLILYESGMTFFFTLLGIPFSTAVIVTLIYRLLAFWLPMPAGLFFYRRWLKEGKQ